VTASDGPSLVRLRAVEDADLSIFLTHQDDPIAAAMAAFATRDPQAFLEHWAEIRADPAVVTRTITVGDAVVGDIVCWVEAPGRREVGYWIGREHWGRGYATAALRLLLEDVPDRPIEARVAEHNARSRRVLEHCGFLRVGETDADGFREGIYRLD
jgi:RimJ/RimL family protein N-acetyltransferase